MLYSAKPEHGPLESRFRPSFSQTYHPGLQLWSGVSPVLGWCVGKQSGKDQNLYRGKGPFIGGKGIGQPSAAEMMFSYLFTYLFTTNSCISIWIRSEAKHKAMAAYIGFCLKSHCSPVLGPEVLIAFQILDEGLRFPWTFLHRDLILHQGSQVQWVIYEIAYTRWTKSEEWEWEAGSDLSFNRSLQVVANRESSLPSSKSQLCSKYQLDSGFFKSPYCHWNWYTIEKHKLQDLAFPDLEEEPGKMTQVCKEKYSK